MTHAPTKNDSLASSLASLPKPARDKILASLTAAERRRLSFVWRFWARSKQLPPDDPDWLYWLLLAGRGFGKTRTGAEWIRERVKRGARHIIFAGATASDLRDIMIEGESGILAISPDWERPKYEPSKARLTWPNGAKALLLSADSPERFRGKQSDSIWLDELGCLAPGTLVATATGEMPIDRVKSGQFVWTRRGLRRVVWAGKTGHSEPLFELTTKSGRVVRGTGNHRVFTEETGWTLLSDLKPDLTLIVRGAQSNGVELAGTRTEKTGIGAIGMANCCTSLSGKASTGRVQNTSIFTTRTRTETTTTFPTSKSSHPGSISAGTAPEDSSPFLLRNGSNSQPPRGPGRNPRPDHASSAACCLPPPGSARPSAAPIAEPGIDECQESTTRLEYAPSVEQNSRSISTERIDVVHESVLRVTELGKRSEVYDLSVDGVHEYFANGVLVHNSWRYPESWDQLKFGLRLGHAYGIGPRAVISTTPRPTDVIRALIKDPKTRVVTGSTYENQANLADAFIHSITREYEGTRLGRQELWAELLDDVPGALWARSLLDRLRIRPPERPPQMRRIVVSIDPSVTANAKSDECGIVVAGLGTDGHGYILDDLSGRMSAKDWGTKAIVAYQRWKADRIVAEVNNGGDLVEANIRAVQTSIPNLGHHVAYKAVHASRGKRARAEPVAALDERGLLHHVGSFPKMEDEMCTWDPTMTNESPNRIDARVWAITELMLEPTQVHRSIGLNFA